MKKVKIRLTENSKRIINMMEKPIVDEMIQAIQNDHTDECISDPYMLGIAMSCITSYNGDWKFYDIQAEIAKNRRIYNYYTENSADFDVWISFKAFDEYSGFYIVHCYLSDIFSVSSENKSEIRQHMYVREYAEMKR